MCCRVLLRYKHGVYDGGNEWVVTLELSPLSSERKVLGSSSALLETRLACRLLSFV